MNYAPRGGVNGSDSDYADDEGDGDDDDDDRGHDHVHADAEKNADHDHPSCGLAYSQESHHQARPKGHGASCVRSTLPPHRRQESFQRHVRSRARQRHRAFLSGLRYHPAVCLGPLIHAPREPGDSEMVCIVAARPDGHFIVSVYTAIQSSNKLSEVSDLLIFPVSRDALALTGWHPCCSNGANVIRLSYRRVTSVRRIPCVRLEREVVRSRL